MAFDHWRRMSAILVRAHGAPLQRLTVPGLLPDSFITVTVSSVLCTIVGSAKWRGRCRSGQSMALASYPR